MTFSESTARGNSSGYLYTKGKEDTDGSIRLSINPFTGIARIEERINGIWEPASFEADSSSVWVGPRVGVGGVGRHLVTQDSDSNRDLLFFAHNSFDGELSTSDAKIINAYDFEIRSIVVGDDSGEWSGTAYTYNYPSPDHRMLAKAYYKTGAIAATSPVRLQVWEGADDTGPVVFDQTYPEIIFIANSEIIITANGFVEFEKDLNYYVMLSSENNFSLRTTLDEVFPWTAGDISLVREDDMLQAIPYVDGDTFTEGQWAIKNLRIYKCNVTGVQTGTFEDNSDKWDILGSGDGLALGETDTTAYRGDRGKIAYDHSQLTTGNPHSLDTDDVTEATNEYYTESKVSANTSVSNNTAKRSYPLADENKLIGIQSGAQVNQSDAQIKTQYENNSNTNVFEDSEKTKLGSLTGGRYLGVFADLTALQTAHPIGVSGDNATVTSPDGNIFYWDTGSTSWLDSGTGFIGDMNKAVYDPTAKNTDAFSMGNMSETATKKILSDTERTNLSNQSGTNSGDVTLEAGSTTQESLDLTGQEVKANLVTQSSDGVMSQQDKTELDNISANGGGDGWISGLDVVQDSPKGTTVLYGAGTYLINGDSKAVTPAGVYDLANGFGSVDHYSGMTNDQHAIVTIYADSAEVIKSIRGNVGEKGSTIFPPLQPSDTVCVAYVEIKVNSGGTPKEIDDKHIFDCRTSPSINTDETVSVSVDDQSTGFLADKLSNNGNVTFTIENPGGNETIKADAPGGGGTVDPSILYTGTSDIDGLDVTTLYPSGILWIDSTADVAVKSLLNGQDKQIIKVVSLSLKKTRISNNTGVADPIMVEGNADVIADKYGGATLIYNASKGNWYFIGIN